MQTGRGLRMAQASKTFRIFVSSTFSDLKAERNALQARVFPRLRDLCAKHGARFQAIDLRWGVSEEASLDQQAMNICLGEIARCQQTTPRPNFIVLLGDRYGWRPPPSQIPADEFGRILEAIEDDADRALLKEWYSLDRLDRNAVPPEYRLKARERGGVYEAYAAWQPVEARLQSILAGAVTRMGFTDQQRLPYTGSATEQEINAGALQVGEASEHVYCFFREIEGLPEGFNARAFHREVEARLLEEYEDGSPEPVLAGYLAELGQLDPASTAKHVDERIETLLESTPDGSLERERLSQIRGWLGDFTGRDFQNMGEGDWIPDADARASQARLRERLQAHVPGNVYRYQAGWTGRGITIDHIDPLCKDVYDSLSGIILKEIEEPHQVATPEDEAVLIQPDDALDDEGSGHRSFAEERLRYFVGRAELLGKIADYVKRGSEPRALVVFGAGGTGKSALVAKAVQQAQAAHSGSEIVYRFIGATPGSSDGRGLLDSLCRELSRRYGASESDIPTDYRELAPEFGNRLALANADRPLILFLDSLDQLSPQQGARSLTWLPDVLPDHVRVIATTRKEDTLDRLQAKQARLEELGGLSREEGDQLLSEWLADAGRTLQGPQRAEVLDKFIRSDGAPLYLKLACEEARLWKSGDGQPPESLAPRIDGIIERNLIDRLADDGNHGQVLVSRVLGYLAASRYGLAEDELVDLLSRDLQLYEWFFRQSYHLPADLVQRAIQYRISHSTGEPHIEDERGALAWLREIRDSQEQAADFLREVLPKPDGPKLPVVLWSRLSFDLEPYLSERFSEGSALLAFYHRELGDVSSKVFLSDGRDQPFHERLADYFRFRADPGGDGRWDGGAPRGLSELPYHLTKAARWDEVYETLTDFRFLEQKAAEVGVLERQDERGNPVRTYTGVLQLQKDYDQALAAMPGEGGSGSGGGEHALIVTAVDRGEGLTVYCPVCNKTSSIGKEQLDSVITCPVGDCNARLKVNPFVVERS